jgi:hypothetical protein
MNAGVEGAVQRGIVFWLAIIASIFLAAAGCSYGPSGDQLRALSESKRSWCLVSSSVYVPTLMVGGTGVEGGTMQCTMGGMRVNDRGTSNDPVTLPPLPAR